MFCSPVTLPVVVTLSVVHKPGATASPGSSLGMQTLITDTLEQNVLTNKVPRDLTAHQSLRNTAPGKQDLSPAELSLYKFLYPWCSAVSRCSKNIRFNFLFWNDLYLEKSCKEVAKLIWYSHMPFPAYPNGHSLCSCGTMTKVTWVN